MAALERLLLVELLSSVAFGVPEGPLQRKAALLQDLQCAAPEWAALVQVGSGPKRSGLQWNNSKARSQAMVNHSLKRSGLHWISSKPHSQAIANEGRNLEARGPLASNVSVGQAEQLLMNSAVTGQARGMLALMQHSILDKSARSEGGHGAVSTFVLPVLALLIVGIVVYVAMMTLDFRKPPQASSMKVGGIAKAPWQSSGSGEGLPTESLLPQSGRPSALRTRNHSLPIVCDRLIMDHCVTRLAVPVLTLQDPHFELDVLGGSGAQLLTAAALTHGNQRFIEIRLFAVGTLLTFLTADLQITQADGTLIGTLVQQSSAPSFGENNLQQYVLQDPTGSNVMAIFSGLALQEMKMAALKVDGSLGEYVSRVTRRPAGRLPAEHYEVVVNPGLDAVLMLSCFLALTAFALPPPSSLPLGLQRPATTLAALETLPQARRSLASSPL